MKAEGLVKHPEEARTGSWGPSDRIGTPMMCLTRHSRENFGVLERRAYPMKHMGVVQPRCIENGGSGGIPIDQRSWCTHTECYLAGNPGGPPHHGLGRYQRPWRFLKMRYNPARGDRYSRSGILAWTVDFGSDNRSPMRGIWHLWGTCSYRSSGNRKRDWDWKRMRSQRVL